MKKLVTKLKFAALATACCLGLAAQAAATYDYIAEVLVSKYADKDPTTSDDHAKWYSTYCLTQDAARKAMGTTDTVNCETYAAWLGGNFEANKQAAIDNAQSVSYDSKTVNQYVFAYALGMDFSELNDALAVVFFQNDDGDLAYNVLASKDGETEFKCDDEYYGSSGWKAVSPAAPIEAMISDVTAKQRYPWNGKVDIAYTATNVLAAAEAKSMDAKLAVMAIDKSTTPWTTNVAEAVCLFDGPRGARTLPLDEALSNGAHRIVWDMNAQGLSNKSDKVVFVVSAVEATLGTYFSSPQSAEVKLDLATGTVRTAATTETLTYSTEWDGGDAVTLAVSGTTLASGLAGSGTYDWTPDGTGTFMLTHTVTTSGVDVVLSATFAVPVARNVTTGTEYATVQAAFDEAASGQTIALMTDVTENISSRAGRACTLDLAGYVLKGDGSAPVIKIDSTTAAITVRDTSAGRTGAITTGGATYSGNGAGIQVAYGSLSLYGVTLTNCVANGNGGAIYGDPTSEILVVDCRVQDNEASQNGGGIYKENSSGVGDGKLVLIGTVVTGNRAGTNGGGIYYNGSACLAAGSLVTMADGTVKAIEEVKEGDVVRTFDHEGGTNSSGRVYLVSKGEGKAVPFMLEFDGGSTLSIVGCHDLLLKDTRKYVTITDGNVEQYLGSAFYGEDGAWHTLTHVTRGTTAVDYYSIYSSQHQNVYVNGLLTVSDDVDYLLNIYALDENLKADAAQLAADVAEYGYFTYERAATYGVDSEAWYVDSGIKYLNVAIGKKLVSLAYLESLFASVDGGRGATALPATSAATDRALSPLSAALPALASAYAEPTLDDFAAGYLTLGANTAVTNNFVGETASNIHLCYDSSSSSYIALASEHAGLCAGITLANGTGQFTTTDNVTAADTQYFTSDKAAYGVQFVTDHLELVAGIQVGDTAWAYVEGGVCTIRGSGAMWGAEDWASTCGGANSLAAVKNTITSLVVEDGVTSIGAQAFHKFYALTNVTCAASVETVGDYAFYRCNSLAKMSFAADNTVCFGTSAYTLQAGIYMKDGIPEVYPIPEIEMKCPYAELILLGTNDLSDPYSWKMVTEETKKSYHFFRYEIGEVL